MSSLRARASASFTVAGADVSVQVDGICLRVECEADIGILHEIFVERIYCFEAAGPFVVLDIGANIGAASLFFARNYDCEVEAYELVPTTSALAKVNLGLNPDLGARISLHECGLSDEERELEIQASIAMRPSNSIVLPGADEGVPERVKVLDVAPVVRRILSDHQGRRMVLKVDAEGAEYEILRRLGGPGLLSEPWLIFVEWHPRDGYDPEDLRVLLRQAGFEWFERENLEVSAGLICAYRKWPEPNDSVGPHLVPKP